MNGKPYKLIVSLLIFSVLFVLVLQGFWIRNFYFQKQDEFNKTVYAALERIAAKLEERENVKAVKEKFIFDQQNSGKPRNGLSIRKTVTRGSYAQVGQTKKDFADIRIIHLDSLKKGMQQIKVSDSTVTILGPRQTFISKTEISSMTGKPSEVDKLMNKMLMEIKIIDTDEKNSDTLNSIIKRVFANKGLLIPFEFSLRKVFKNKEEILAGSKGFNEKAKSFVTDLSANRVFSTHNFLFVQFPLQSDFVFSSMKNMLLLSLVFSLIILGVFYYTIRLIMKQKKLNEIKNDFINNMTHELKTPIATISLAVDAINNPLVKSNDAKFQDYNRILKEENQKLNHHVERVLQMAQLDKGELPLRFSRLNLVPLIEASLKTFALQIQTKHTQIKFHPHPLDITIHADGQHLKTVFDNLIDNALKYSGQNGELEISIKPSLDYVLIKFKDNGIGIDATKQKRVFEKFYRAQGGNLHDVKGFGLGLSYVKSIIEAHGGSIELQSEKGKGSEFSIWLRVAGPKGVRIEENLDGKEQRGFSG